MVADRMVRRTLSAVGGDRICGRIDRELCISVSWVFSERTLHSRIAEFTAFVSIGIVGLGLNEAILWSMTDFLELHYLISKTVATAAVFFWNFTARKYLLFNGKNRE